MLKIRYLLIFSFLFWLNVIAVSQTGNVLSGKVVNEQDQPLAGVHIQVSGSRIGVYADSDGKFSFKSLPNSSVKLRLSHVGYETLDTLITISDEEFTFRLKLSVVQLSQIGVTAQREIKLSVLDQQLEAASAVKLSSAFGDFSRVIATLPGVSSNNELSSGYAVRGGNFDENLVYVNDIPVYRPFLSNAGQQEGLSFVNPDLVSSVRFSSGGWEAKYGDKLSSNLLIDYREPTQLTGRLNLGLLGGSAAFGGISKNYRNHWIVGIRHRDSRYLLNTLEVQGQYFPRYTDFQSLLSFDLSSKSSPQLGKTKLYWLSAYSQNRYLTIPESLLTEFGSIQATFRLQTDFEGREILNYDTYQTGLKLTHRFSERYNTHLMGYAVTTAERENFEVEGAYRLCDVNKDPSSTSFDNCVLIRGLGSEFRYGRNRLDAVIGGLENRHELQVSDQLILQAGLGWTGQVIRDQLYEYRFIDSAGFVSNLQQIDNSLNLQNQQGFAFIQSTFFSRDTTHQLNAGIRFHYYTLNGQLLASPRIQYRWVPKWAEGLAFSLAWGYYQQPPFYRELRDRTGVINQDIRAQRAIHYVMGLERFFLWQNRPFTFTASAYYKALSSLVPFEIDNVRLRYYATNAAKGFATGLDMRINGEFIKGTQSWFSLSLLKTMENLEGDERGLVRRPLDQRITLAAYFEDHMPGDPSLRVYVTLNLGSGYPFGPPGNLALRNRFQGDEYYRADLGISKLFGKSRYQQQVRLEILNAFGADNTLAYSWITDVNGASFAVPNSLSARLLNLRWMIDF